MIQEIITYLIIGTALTLAMLKILNRFSKKRRKHKGLNRRKESIAENHKCAGCTAECVLRDSATPAINSQKDLCQKEAEDKSDEL